MRRCKACGRRLRKSPNDLGPVCARRLGIAPEPARVSPATTPAPHVEGQTEIPLADQLDLWSI